MFASAQDLSPYAFWQEHTFTSGECSSPCVPLDHFGAQGHTGPCRDERWKGDRESWSQQGSGLHQDTWIPWVAEAALDSRGCPWAFQACGAPDGAEQFLSLTLLLWQWSACLQGSRPWAPKTCQVPAGAEGRHLGQAGAEGLRAKVTRTGLQPQPCMWSVPLLMQPVCSPSLCLSPLLVVRTLREKETTLQRRK